VFKYKAISAALHRSLHVVCTTYVNRMYTGKFVSVWVTVMICLPDNRCTDFMKLGIRSPYLTKRFRNISIFMTIDTVEEMLS
jgi:hypothetical protein